MTRTEFLSLNARCRYCFSFSLTISEAKPPHRWRVDCISCSRFIQWLQRSDKPKPKQNRKKYKRPGIGVPRTAVWEAYGNRCVSCGVRREDFERLGWSGHVHHVQRFKDVGNETIFVPLCEKCHENAEKVRRSHLRGLGIIR